MVEISTISTKYVLKMIKLHLLLMLKKIEPSWESWRMQCCEIKSKYEMPLKLEIKREKRRKKHKVGKKSRGSDYWSSKSERNRVAILPTHIEIFIKCSFFTLLRLLSLSPTLTFFFSKLKNKKTWFNSVNVEKYRLLSCAAWEKKTVNNFC